MTGGSDASTPPAAISPKSTELRPVNSAMATGIVLEFPVEVKISEYRNSSQQSRNANSPVAITPGLASGRITRNSAPSRVQPSTRAASSSSRGSEPKKLLIVHSENGVTSEQYTMISPVLLSSSCTLASNRYSGITRVIGGSMYVARNSSSVVRRNGNRS